jgi:hypothetical protein
MDAHYTSNLLLPLLYRELPVDQLDPIFEALKIDDRLRAEFVSLRQAKQALSSLRLEPRQSCIDNIMAFSRAVHS